KGKKEEYIKDEGLMTSYLMKQATTDLEVKSAGEKQAISGNELAKWLERMVDFKHYCERASRRLAGDGRLLDALLEALAGKKGQLRKEGSTLRKVFQDEDLLA